MTGDREPDEQSEQNKTDSGPMSSNATWNRNINQLSFLEKENQAKKEKYTWITKQYDPHLARLKSNGEFACMIHKL